MTGMRRRGVAQTIADLIGFAKVVAVRLGASKSAEVQAEAVDGDGSAWSELWGHAPLVYRPAPGAECLYVELGDERVVFATKDRRWQVETGPGEVVLRAIGSGAAYLRLTPDGLCEVAAESVKLGKGAAEKVALADLVKQAIDAAIGAHTHASFSAPGVYVAPLTPGGAPSVAASKVEAE